MTPLRRLAFCAVVIAIVVSGCRNPFNPDTRESTTSPSYILASTPEQVLLNLEEAYDKQDIDLFKQCLSSEFKFVLIASEIAEIGVDMDNDGIRDNWWGYTEEITYHENLFARGSSNGIYPAPYHILLSLMIPTQSSWEQCVEEGLEDVIIIPCYFDLQLSYTSTSNLVSYGTARFYLRQEDGVWKILRWQDESMVD